MIVVVTGGNSYLAGHLIAALVDHQVTVFATYRTLDARVERIQKLPNVHLVQLDVANQRDFGRLPQQADALVHVAGASVARAGSVEEFISCNVLGARNVARYALDAGISKLVYTSTMSVYGTISVPNVDENCPITNPDDYGLTKYLAERVFAQTEGLSCVALRLPGILGKGAHRAWIPSVVNRLLQGHRDATIYSPESLFNNGAHVADVSEFVWRLLNSEMSGFRALNIAADDQMTVAEIVDLMNEMLGEKIAVTVLPALKPSFLISSERAKALGYKPGPIRHILRRYFSEAGLDQVKARALST